MIHFKIYNSQNDLPDSWQALTTHDLFLQKPYLTAVENASPDNMSWYYVGVFNAENLVGIAIIQRVQLYVEDIFRNHKDSCFQERVKHYVSKVLKGNVLVVGNLMHTGQHGLYFNAEAISEYDFLFCVFEAVYQLKKDIKSSKGKTIRTLIFKDYFEDDSIHSYSELFKTNTFRKVSVQPNMIMPTHKNWNTFNDYQISLNKKYRRRLKTARKKASAIQKKELNLDAIETHSELLFSLYKNVSDNARINTFILPKNHFYTLKKELKDQFKVFAYYLDGTLVGFYTLILNNKVLETYFLGYDSAHQYNHQLYLNMLYDMAEFAINNKFEHTVYARTAMEIKSSVGAKPKNMFIYLRHTNVLLNAALNLIFSLMNPTRDWEERHPFN